MGMYLNNAALAIIRCQSLSIHLVAKINLTNTLTYNIAATLAVQTYKQTAGSNNNTNDSPSRKILYLFYTKFV